MKRDGHVEHLDRTSTKNNIPPICSCILGHECFKYRYSSVSLNELQILISGLFQKDRRFTGKGIVQRSIWTCLSLLSVLSSQPATFESTEVCSQLHALAAEEELKPKPEISTLQNQQQGLWYEVNTPHLISAYIGLPGRKKKKRTPKSQKFGFGIAPISCFARWKSHSPQEKKPWSMLPLTGILQVAREVTSFMA